VIKLDNAYGDNLDNFELRSRKNGPDPIENLVLEGGGVKGSAYVGVVKALEESGHLSKLKRVAGSSAGGIMALMIGLGLTADEIAKEMDSMDFRKFQDYGYQTWAEFFRLGPAIKTFNVIEHFMVGLFSHKKGAYHGDYFMDWAEKWVAKKLGNPNATFRDLHERIELGDTKLKDMVFTGTVLAGKDAGSLSYFRYEEGGQFNDMSIAKAVRITMSFPAVFEMVEHEGCCYADGGIANNFPMEAFDDSLYMTKDMNRTKSGKNPRTIGFKIDNWSEWAIQKDLVQMAIDAGILHSRDEPLTEEAYKETIDWAFQKKKLDLVEKKALLNRSILKSMGIKSYVSNLFSAIGDSSQVVFKVLNYPGRAFQIHDQDVSTLDFDLMPKKKSALIDAGYDVGMQFVSGYQQEQDRSYLDTEEYSHRSKTLWQLFEINFRENNIGNVAVCYHIMQESLKQLKKEKSDLETSLSKKPNNEYSQEKINSLKKMISISEVWLNDVFSGLRENIGLCLDSEAAKNAVDKYNKNKSTVSKIQDKNIQGADQGRRADDLKSKIEDQLNEATLELKKSKSVEQELDEKLKKIDEEYSSVLDIFNNQETQEKEFILVFHDSLEKLNDLKVKKEALYRQLIETPVGDNKITALYQQKEEYVDKIHEIIENFYKELKKTGLSDKRKWSIKKLFSKILLNGCNTEEEIQRTIKAEKDTIHALKKENEKSREILKRKIKETEKRLEDYKSSSKRVEFFVELVELRQSLNDEIVKYRSTFTDYLQYGCELLFKGYTDFFGDIAIQKILRERQARDLKLIVDSAYEKYRHSLEDKGEPDKKILDLIELELRVVAKAGSVNASSSNEDALTSDDDSNKKTQRVKSSPK
jgi:NTE family protein